MPTLKPACSPVLTAGSAHDDVQVLGQLLAKQGYENSVSRGENPFSIVDQSVLQAAQAFASARSVEPEDIPNVPVHERRNWIGPNLWKALAKPVAKAAKAV